MLQAHLLAAAAGLFAAAPARGAPGDEALFRERVAPVLERRCLACHGDARRKGGFSLADAASALAESDSGRAIVPGDPAASLLVELVSGPDPEMPRRGEPLAADEVAALSEWIARGAAWPEDLALAAPEPDDEAWWSLAPLVPPPVPALPPELAAAARNEVDAFVLARLAERGLAPSPEADRRTLLRRLSYDLTGLPPTPEELDAFLADARPDAYEHAVERLLASPRYGERWARHWLDVAHYADTHGYDKDKRRPNAWPYRDWVIDALNVDMPYADFVERQLAGDVLAPDDAASVIATGFVVAGPWDFVGHVELREGTVDKEIVRNLDRDDMVASAISSFASTTAACARCHDHKFDPVSQEDYYALQAVFAGVERADREFDRDPHVRRRRAELRAELARFEPEGLRTLGYHSAIEPAAEVEKWVQVDLGRLVPIERVVLLGAHEAYGGHPGPGFGFPPRLRVEGSFEPTFTEPSISLLETLSGEFENPGDAPVELFPSMPLRARYVRVTATRLWERTDDFAFALGELAVYSRGENVALGAEVSALDTIEAGERWGTRLLVDGRFGRTSFAALEAARRPEDGPSPVAPLRRRLALEAELARLPAPAQVFAARPLPDGEVRPVHLLGRGDVRARGDEVEPGALAAVRALPARFALDPEAGEGARRLALARWLTHRDNPLTWRSIANRVWHHHFGRGLVATPNDFGRMGELPTHPALLDWLAVRLRDGGGSLKELHRTIVTSATWRQSSNHRPGCARVDADNRLLWRANRRRLEAEALRDTLLAVSGCLDLTMGGPGFDAFAFEDDHSPRYAYAEHDPEDPRSWRRAVYRTVVRSVPDPLLEAFDCADPSLQVPARDETTTALQALALLNDRFVLSQARHLAARLEADGDDLDDLEGQVERAVLLALCRPPTARERAALARHAERFGLDQACRALFNLSEMCFVD